MLRRFLGFPLTVVGLTLAALGVFASTESAPESPPMSSGSPEVVVVATDVLRPTASCDIDPHFSRRLPVGSIDPAFSVTVSPDGAWADVDPGFSVRIPCLLETVSRRAPAATPAP